MFGIGIIPVAHADIFSKSDLITLAEAIANEHNVLDVPRFVQCIELESHFNPYALGDYRNGAPTSWGIAQFRYPLRDWGISTTTSMQPIAAMERMAQAWQDGFAYKWACWKLTKPTITM